MIERAFRRLEASGAVDILVTLRRPIGTFKNPVPELVWAVRWWWDSEEYALAAEDTDDSKHCLVVAVRHAIETRKGD